MRLALAHIAAIAAFAAFLTIGPSAASASQCGQRAAAPAGMSFAEFAEYRCMTRSEAGGAWSRCLGWRAYAPTVGDGCPGAELCCPPTANRAGTSEPGFAASTERRTYSKPTSGEASGAGFFIGLIVVGWLLTGLFGAAIASSRGRGLAGFFLTLIFGPMGVIMALLMPSKIRPVLSNPPVPKPVATQPAPPAASEAPGPRSPMAAAFLMIASLIACGLVFLNPVTVAVGGLQFAAGLMMVLPLLASLIYIASGLASAGLAVAATVSTALATILSIGGLIEQASVYPGAVLVVGSPLALIGAEVCAFVAALVLATHRTSTPARVASQEAAAPERRCPECAEVIQAEARVCRYCGERLLRQDPADAAASADLPMPKEFPSTEASTGSPLSDQPTGTEGDQKDAPQPRATAAETPPTAPVETRRVLARYRRP